MQRYLNRYTVVSAVGAGDQSEWTPRRLLSDGQKAVAPLIRSSRICRLTAKTLGGLSMFEHSDRRRAVVDRWTIGLAGLVLLMAGICALAVSRPATAWAQTAGSSPPTEVVTEPAEPTANGVKLKGEFNPGGLSTTYYFEYSSVTCDELPSCVQRTSVAGPLNGDTQQEAPAIEVTGLKAETTYSYRIVASNADGTEGGAFVKFTTGSSPGEQNPISEPLTPPEMPSAVVPPTTKTPDPPPTNRPLTNAQRLKKALRTCRHKPKKHRRRCAKLARVKYGLAARKRHQRT